jgi:hypothetical protein
MANKTLNTTFTAKDGGLISQMKEAGASADQLKKKLQELQSVGKKGKGGGGGDDEDAGGVVKSIKGQLGAKSDLGQLAKALKGGGAVLGIRLISAELKQAADQAKLLKDQFDAGAISGSQVAVGVAKTIPILGDIVNAGESLSQLWGSFDGLANSGFGKFLQLDGVNALQKINKELEVSKGITEYINGSLERQKNILKECTEERVKFNQENGKIGREGDNLKQYELQIGAENRLTEIQKKRTEALDTADKKKNEALGKAREAGKGLDPVQQNKLEQQVLREGADEKKKINAGFDDDVRAANSLSFSQQMQAEKEHGEKIADFKSDTSKEITDIQTEAYARNLKSLGDGLGAELVMIQKNAQDKKDAIIKALKEQSKGASLGDQDLYNKAATAKIAAVDADAQQEAKLARKAQQEAAVKTLQEGQLAVLRNQADSGDEYAKAELERLETAKARNDEEKKLLDLLKQELTPQERAAALAELQALKTADHAGVVKQLQSQQEDALKAQAENGATPAAQREAQQKLEVLKLQKEYNAEAAKAAAIINNPQSNAADKAAAQANLKAYASTLGNQYDKDLGNESQPLKKTASLEERGLLITGVAAAARAKKDPSETIAQNTKEAKELQKQALDAFNQFVQWQQQQATTNPTIMFGVGDDGSPNQ